MLRFFVVLFFIAGGYSYQAYAQLSISTEDRTQSGGSRNDGDCPYADGGIVIAIQHDSTMSGGVTLTIKCAPNANDAKTKRYTAEVTLASGAAQKEITLADHNMDTGDHCTVEASISEESTPNVDSDSEKATADFTVGYKQIAGAPTAEIVGGITAGKEFKIGNLFFKEEIPFFDLLLRECTASNDPWIFWHKPGKDSEEENVLHRVYPTSTNSDNRTSVEDKDTSNDNHCLGLYDGELRRLVTIGDDHSGCKFKLVKEDVLDGEDPPSIVTFTEQGNPALATNAAVTVSNGSVMLHTGSKPSTPAGIANNIAVFISTNRGFTWTESDIAAWTSATTDSGVAAAKGGTDNTRNMAMVKLTDGTNVWWRIIKGQ